MDKLKEMKMNDSEITDDSNALVHLGQLAAAHTVFVALMAVTLGISVA